MKRKFQIRILENVKVESVEKQKKIFLVKSAKGDSYTAKHVLLAIGRRGSPRKLNIPGENLEKVADRLLEPEQIEDKKILVVGGGDSAVESALLLMEKNNVTLSYRAGAFKRVKPKNLERINAAMAESGLKVLFDSQPVRIEPGFVELQIEGQDKPIRMDNDLVYIFAGGELPTEFLRKTGIEITRKHGETLMKHK